jgi:hypothetical protein
LIPKNQDLVAFDDVRAFVQNSRKSHSQHLKKKEFSRSCLLHAKHDKVFAVQARYT